MTFEEWYATPEATAETPKHLAHEAWRLAWKLGAEAQREACADEFEKAARQEPDDPIWLDIAADIRSCDLVTLPKGEG